MTIDPLLQMNDPLRKKLEREIEDCEVLGLPVRLIWTTDEYHEYGGNYTYGWKTTIGKHQYGDFVGNIFTNDEKPEAKKVLLEQCALSIEAIRKEADGTTA